MPFDFQNPFKAFRRRPNDPATSTPPIDLSGDVDVELDPPATAIYVGGAGTLVYMAVDDDFVSSQPVVAGVYPVSCKIIYRTSTATDLRALKHS